VLVEVIESEHDDSTVRCGPFVENGSFFSIQARLEATDAMAAPNGA